MELDNLSSLLFDKNLHFTITNDFTMFIVIKEPILNCIGYLFLVTNRVIICYITNALHNYLHPDPTKYLQFPLHIPLV